MSMSKEIEMQELREKYEELFTSNEAKAQAFDKIAENYYFRNFGTMQKSDLDVLLFSIYIEEILKKSENDINTYSDYRLAKLLGISQNKVSSLKVKKQLQYPYPEFDWKKSFKRVCANARYEKEKIRINLRDKNLYYELKNQIDEKGGFVETTLTSNLLVISVSDFYELSEQLMSQHEIDEMKKAIKSKYAGDIELCEAIEKKTIGKALKAKFGDTMIDVICEVIKNIAPTPIGIGLEILKTTFNTIKSSIEGK